MTKLYVSQRLPQAYNRAALQEIVRVLEEQANSLAEGRIVARHTAVASVPTTGNFTKGDLVWDSNPTLATGSVRVGWICTASGTPGTFQELKVPTGVFPSFSQITASLGADVAMNNTANYFTGPQIAQGSTGTWFVSGSVTVYDTAGTARMLAKLWDGTTVIASGEMATNGINAVVFHLSGYLASPAGNLRISVRDVTSTNGVIAFNASGNSKDSTISAFRIA